MIDSNLRSRFTWRFMVDDARHSVQVRGRVEVNSPSAVRLAVLAGLGYGSVPYVMIKDDLEAGRLEVVLADYEVRNVGIFVVYPHRRHLSAKIRAFVDYMVDWFDKNGRECAAGM